MINIKDKHNCSGCGACAQKCSKQCITLKQDSEGFLYPEVDTENCINCGLCENVCPVQHPFETREPLQTLAAINKDEKVRLESSSGGIFTLLAESVLDDAESVISLIQEELKPTLEMIRNEKIRVIKALPKRIVKKLIRLMGGKFAEANPVNGNNVDVHQLNDILYGREIVLDKCYFRDKSTTWSTYNVTFTFKIV